MTTQEPSPHYDNPYAATELVTVDPPVVIGVKRPVFIALLAVLQIVGGVLLILSLITLANTSYTVGTIPSLRLLWITIPSGLMRLMTGVGMWIGARWGWWLASTYYMMQLFSAVATFVMVKGLVLEPDVLGRPRSYLLGRAIGGVSMSIIVLVVLYRPNVLAFFCMNGQAKRPALAVTALCGLLLYVAQQYLTMAV